MFKYQPKEKTFSLALQFKRTEVPRDEVVRALQSIIDELLREKASAGPPPARRRRRAHRSMTNRAIHADQSRAAA